MDNQSMSDSSSEATNSSDEEPEETYSSRHPRKPVSSQTSGDKFLSRSSESSSSDSCSSSDSDSSLSSTRSRKSRSPSLSMSSSGSIDRPPARRLSSYALSRKSRSPSTSFSERSLEESPQPRKRARDGSPDYRESRRITSSRKPPVPVTTKERNDYRLRSGR